MLFINNIFQLTTYVTMIIIHSMSLLVYIYLLILCNNYSKILYLINLRNFDKVFGKSRKNEACKVLDRNISFIFHIIVAFANLSGRVDSLQSLISNSLRDVIDVNTSGNPSLKLFADISRVSRFFKLDMLQ